MNPRPRLEQRYRAARGQLADLGLQHLGRLAGEADLVTDGLGQPVAGSAGLFLRLYAIVGMTSVSTGI